MTLAASAPCHDIPPSDVLPRLLAVVGREGGRPGLTEHRARWGPLPTCRGRWLVEEVAASGLAGHGGGWFPVATKWRSVLANRGRSPVVVVNGAESEPASHKDSVLLTRAPHLVLDGAAGAAGALGASRVVVYTGARQARAMEIAIAERRALQLDPVDAELVVAADRFLAGQESAAVNTIGGRPPLPSFTGLRPVRVRGVAGRPTLVQNVETLAHVALVARFGAGWFRGMGTEDAPGTMLLTVTGRWPQRTVVEAPLGARLLDVLGLDPGSLSRCGGALLGGYGGGWLQPAALAGLHLTEGEARAVGSSLGAGVVALLPDHVCPLAEVARVVRYLQSQGAGQCGPCVHGIAELADRLEDLAWGSAPRSRRAGPAHLLELCELIAGRGACAHPDGVARFVRTACSVFSAEIGSHRRRGPCRRAGERAFLPVPADGPR